MKYKTRFAPSPTGALHAGTVRTALFAWLAAHHSGGQFVLRIEDTDRSREVAGATDNIVETLKYLGIDWDEGPDKKGPFGPYIQSQRLEVYKQWAQKLIDAGRAYADPHTPQKLDDLREAAKAAKKPFLFRNHRPDNPPAWDGSQPLRFKSEPTTYKWDDIVMGQISTGPEVVDDFIILKSDGFPTYNFAHIIDDHLMEINLVVRSQEFIPSMPNFLNLYEALGIDKPAFATVPMVLGVEGNQKLSKRRGAKQLLEYQKMGILPEALMNCLATIGWNDGTEQEVYSREELIKKFELSRVQKSPARFDEQRLLWFNGHYIRSASLDELTKLAKNYWPNEAKKASLEYRQQVLGLVQERLKYLAELPDLSIFFFTEPAKQAVLKLLREPVDKQLKQVDKATLTSLLTASFEELNQSNFSESDIAQRLNELLQKLGSRPGILFAAVRIAISGSVSSPQLFGTLATLGKETSLKRIGKAISLLA